MCLQCSRHWAHRGEKRHRSLPSWNQRSRERETALERSDCSPDTCQTGPPCCPGPRSQLRAPRALSLACLQLLSSRHSPHSWASFSGVPPSAETSEDSSVCVSSGTVPAPRLCFSRVSSGRHELRQSPVTAVPRPCPALPEPRQGFLHSLVPAPCWTQPGSHGGGDPALSSPETGRGPLVTI